MGPALGNRLYPFEGCSATLRTKRLARQSRELEEAFVNISHLGSALPREFYERDTVAVARELLGKQLIRAARDGLVRGRIVETEAYLPHGDSACHAARGKTRKNASMFGRPGWAYVYAIHSRWCFNVVTEPRGVPAAVLIRAVEPLEGVPQMEKRRRTHRLLDLARGPARLCEAFDIDRRLDAWDLCRVQRLWIADDPQVIPSRWHILRTPRIGVTSAHDLALRFVWSPSRFLSGSAKWNRQAVE